MAAFLCSSIVIQCLFRDDNLVIYLSFAILSTSNSFYLLLPLFSCAVVVADRETLEVLDSFLVWKITSFAYLVEIGFRFYFAPGFSPCFSGYGCSDVNKIAAFRV